MHLARSDLYIKYGSLPSSLMLGSCLSIWSWKCCRNQVVSSVVLLPPVPPTVQAVQGRIVGVPERSVTLTFTISDASPVVQTENIQWTFRDLNGNNFNIPINPLTTTFSNLMGVFSSDRLSLTLSGLTNDFEGTYTMTATNEAGSDSVTVELVIEGQVHWSIGPLQVFLDLFLDLHVGELSYSHSLNLNLHTPSTLQVPPEFLHLQ